MELFWIGVIYSILDVHKWGLPMVLSPVYTVLSHVTLTVPCKDCDPSKSLTFSGHFDYFWGYWVISKNYLEPKTNMTCQSKWITISGTLGIKNSSTPLLTWWMSSPNWVSEEESGKTLTSLRLWTWVWTLAYQVRKIIWFRCIFK